MFSSGILYCHHEDKDASFFVNGRPGKIGPQTYPQQKLMRLPSAVWPWRNPISLQFISHKLLRLLVPWALLWLLVASVLLEGPVCQVMFWGQTAMYTLGLAGMVPTVSTRFRIASAAASFLVLNFAAWLAFWIWVSGRAGRSWTKVRYAAREGPRSPCAKGVSDAVV